MKITIIGGPFQPWPPAPCGSIERIWQGLAEQFVRAGHHVTAVTQRHPSQPARETLAGVEYIRKWRMSRTRSVKRDIALDMLFSLRMLSLAPAADIIVPHTFWLPWLWPRLRNGKLVAHIQRYPKKQIQLYLRSALITTVSQTISDGIVQQCPESQPLVRVIPNPIHTAVFTPPDQPRQYNNPDGTIVYTGRIHPEKGLDLLVTAYRKLRQQFPQIRLRLIGPSEISRGGGGPEFVEALQKLAGDCPVEILPSIDSIEKLAQALRDGEYYCYPSVAEMGEASPVAPLEAMATGLPCVVSDLSQFRGYVDPGRNALVFDHRSPQAADNLASALGALIGDPQRSASVGDQAAQTAQKFSYSAIAELYLAEFRRISGN